MKVDVIIPAYNPDYGMLNQAIKSIDDQTWGGDIEITIIDDNSAEPFDKIIKSKKHKINYIRNSENLGPAGTRNVGIRYSDGDFVSFLDADDVWSPNKLLWSLPEFEKDPDIGMTCGNYRFLIRNQIGKVFYKKPVSIDWKALMRVNYVASGSTTVRRHVFEKVGLFNEKYWIAEDYDLWLRISEEYKVKYIHKILYYYRIVPGSNSLTQRDDIQKNHMTNLKAIKEESRKRVDNGSLKSKA